MRKAGFAMALHGGAGARKGRDYAREIEHMRGLIEAGRDRLASGASAMDVVVETVCALEDSALMSQDVAHRPTLRASSNSTPD